MLPTLLVCPSGLLLCLSSTEAIELMQQVRQQLVSEREKFGRSVAETVTSCCLSCCVMH